MQKDYDVIVIGSGAGGLSAALPLAQSGMRVLVCEQHEVPGGWTHSFTLNGYRFSPGVHYIGALGPGGSLRRIYQGLGVSEYMAFCELNPQGYDHFFLGEKAFDFPKGKEPLIQSLQARFPAEKQGIQNYFTTVNNLMNNLHRLDEINNLNSALKSAPGMLSVLKWLKKTGQDLIEAHISDPILKGVLAGQSGDHGLPPSRVSAFVHAGITHHYFNGAYYPLGGAFTIPKAFVKALKKAGGEIRVKSPVERIILQDKKAAGVVLGDGSKITASHIVSNADPYVTFEKMIGRQHLGRGLQKKLNRKKYSVSALSLFFAVDMDLKAAGLDSGNFWYYDSAEVDQIYQLGLTDHVLKAERPSSFFLTVTTLKDPSKMHNGHHTCEAFTFVGYDAFKKWANQKSGARSADYRKLKENLSERMFKALERRIPGIRKQVVFSNLATPLTNEFYINTTRGSLYGIEKTPSQVGPGSFQVQSEIPGLYMCGANTLSHGVAGATVSGLAVAKKILHCRTADLLRMNGPEFPIYPSEHTEKWPEDLQKKIAAGRRKGNE